MTISPTIINSLFIDNANAIYLSYGETNRIVNSVFVNNGDYDIAGGADVVVSMNNNYIDDTKIDVLAFNSNNIFGGNLDFADQANGDYHIGETSVLIDAGTKSVAGVDFPSTDMDGNLRVVGTAIDIGPYEVSTTQPTISSLSIAGNLITGQE